MTEPSFLRSRVIFLSSGHYARVQYGISARIGTLPIRSFAEGDLFGTTAIGKTSTPLEFDWHHGLTLTLYPGNEIKRISEVYERVGAKSSPFEENHSNPLRWSA